MKQNLRRKAFVAFCVFSGQTFITERARIAGNRRPKKYLRKTRRIWPIAMRITRMVYRKLVPTKHTDDANEEEPTPGISGLWLVSWTKTLIS